MIYKLLFFSTAAPRFCVFTHTGQISELDVKGAAGGMRACRFFDSYQLAQVRVV